MRLQKKNTIYGHFLICYLATFLIRVLQIFELEDKNSYQEIFNFIREFKFTKCDGKLVNMATASDFIDQLIAKTSLPLNHAMLTENQFMKIMNFKL